MGCGVKGIDSLKNLLSGNVHSCSRQANKLILKAVQEGSYNFVWFDDFVYGSAARAVKRSCPNIPVFMFYHLVNPSFIENVRHLPVDYKYPFRFWNRAARMRQERIAAKYSDANIVLNDRDGSIFRERYGFEADLILPICLHDNAHITETEGGDGTFNIIFIGGATHYPNVGGIKWFAKHVMPELSHEALLYVIGVGMERLRDDPDFRGNPRIKVVGKVQSLDDFYSMADLIVCPIFYGTGMMTKIAEALMYGKDFLATSHALFGYEGLEERRADSAEEFIRKINALIQTRPARYNPELRKIYEEKYSIEAMKNMLRVFLSGRKLI